MSSEHGYCPKCGADWDGQEIPEDSREFYSGTKFGRQIGVDGGELGIYDGIVAWKCPDCSDYVPRGSDGWAMEMFEKFMGTLNV